MAEQTRPPLVTESLLQELLLALLGFFGDVFVEDGGADQWQHVPDPARCTVRLADYIDWVDLPDRRAACSFRRMLAVPENCWPISTR